MEAKRGGERVAAAAVRALERVNRRYPWDHNAHFHGWILGNLPARRRAALDVGCGAGLLLSRLAESFDRVTGVDLDRGMVAAARDRLATNPRATVTLGDVGDLPPAAAPGEGFDLVTMVAVLHHLDLRATLARIPGLLAPGGRLLVVGLARPGSPVDLAVDLLSALVNPVVGLAKHLRAGRRRPSALPGEPAMPVRAPVTTFAEVSEAARALLPGAVCRRRLFFRYTLRWEKPGPPS